MLRTLIIEDELLAAQRLQKLLAALNPEIEIIGHLESVESAIKWFKSNPEPDLLMLDIQLADGLSFEIFKDIKPLCHVIFTTAYDEYAIKAFELNSIDYLLKPIQKEKLAKSLDKLKHLTTEHRQFNIEELIESIQQTKKSKKKRFIINIGAKIVSIESKNIACFYSLEKSTFLITSEGKEYPVDFSLDKLEGLLDEDLFFRINRQYIVNYGVIKNIHILSRSRIKLELSIKTQDDLLVSSAKSHGFRLWLDR